MMQILQKALDWFKSLFWKVSFATTLITVIDNFIILIIIIFFNVKRAKGQYQLMFGRRRWSSPWSDFRYKENFWWFDYHCVGVRVCAELTYRIWTYHLLDFWIINVHTSD